MIHQATVDMTSYLEDWEQSSPEALSRLVDLAHEHLSVRARGMMRNDRPGYTLQTRTLVHETYIRMLELREINWKGKAHFYAMASSIMRKIMVDHARNDRTQKRARNAVQVSMDDVACSSSDAVDVIALDAALAHLALKDWKQGRIVELRYFGGLKIAEIAENLSMSPATVKRKWTLAQAFLHREMLDSAAACA